MQHNPGNFIDRRGKNKPAPAPLKQDKPPTPFFAEDFIPARGHALIECRFVGASAKVHIPDAVHEQQQYAIVRAMGAGKLHFDGSVIPPEWEVGHFVYAAIANGRRVEFGDKKLVLLDTQHILGRFPTVPQEVIDEFNNEKAKNEGQPAETEAETPAEPEQSSNGDQPAEAS